MRQPGLRRLTTIVAPAGYGKTSLAAQWHGALAATAVATVWVPLEAEDSDQAHFLLTLLEALHPILPGGDKGLDTNGMPVQALLSVLVTRLRRLAAPVVLFLDDYHLAQTDATEALVARLLANADLGHLKLVLTSRSVPRFPTSALRLASELKQIGVADLGFSDDEAQEFFAGKADRLTRDQIRDLNQRTEGWAVALQMVRVLVNDNVDGDGILAAFDGSNPDMGHYLSEQVFSSLPPEIGLLLAETAALPALSRDLTATVSSQADAGVMFSRLGDYALPMASLDPRGQWLRCHPVFNAFLRDEAQRRGIDTHAALRRAALWFEAGGDCDAATRHALLADDAGLAAQIVERAGGWRRVYATTRGGTRLFQALSARVAEINLAGVPLTALGLAVIRAKAGFMDDANHYLGIAERADAAAGNRLEKDLRVVRVLMWLYSDHWVSATDLSALEADLLRAESMELIHRALVLNMLSYNFLIRTDLDRALHYGQLAMRSFRDGGADFGAMHLYTHVGQAAFFGGDSASAADAYASLIAEAQASIGTRSDLDAVGQVLLSEVLSMRGQTGAAATALEWALPHLERHDTWFDLLAAGFLAQQRVLRLGGDLLVAHSAIETARAAARRRGFSRLTRLIEAEFVTLLIASGDIEQAVRYANAGGFGSASVDDGHTNNLAVHLRGSVPALLWTRLHLAQGEPIRARAVFDRLIARQSHSLHVPHRIELGFLEIRLLLAENQPAMAAARLSDVLFSLPVADYCAILQVEGRAFGQALDRLIRDVSVPDVVAQRLAQLLPADRAEPGVPEATGFTERECSVLDLLSTGLSNKQIARQLDLSDNTVKFHLRNIFGKLKVTTRTAAVTAARQVRVLL